MEILENLVGFIFVTVFFIFSYIGIHMSFEKDAKKSIPLIWERGGILHKFLKPQEYTDGVFDKSKIKYRDGDNT
jgi:hypothetical protein